MRDPCSDPSTGDHLARAAAREASGVWTRGGVEYRALQERDLPFVVGQHLHHFPDGFFARLGSRFLTEYYRAFLTSAAARSTVAELDGETVGYLVGVTDPAAHRDHVLRRHGRRLVVRAVLAMLAHPRLAWLFLRTRSALYARKLLRRRPVSDGPSGSSASQDTADTTPTAVLTHVAIVPSAQSHGIGSELIRRFDEQVAAAGCRRLTLVTASGDDGAGPYYVRRGWTALGERCTPDGLRLTTYARDVQAAPAAGPPAGRSEGTA